MKKERHQEEKNEEEIESKAITGTGLMNLDENLLFEVLKHVDASTLGRAACVSKQWHRTVQDERLWELICTRHLANIGCGNQQLRSVVLALGGFRRLHSQYLWPLSKPQSSSAGYASTSSPPSWNPFPPMIGNKAPARWGKDERFSPSSVQGTSAPQSLRQIKEPVPSPRETFKLYRSPPKVERKELATFIENELSLQEPKEASVNWPNRSSNLYNCNLVIHADARPDDWKARPLNVAGAHGSINEGFELVFDGYYIDGIKSGPSHGGIGNKHTNAQTLGPVINSGPSNGGPGN
ncbi:unnamed protein product [Dovyalis caffra]|uniref:F-box protein GID2 n=1 Tax=Dovyalis caffra TaxID=77055 RepID=A0AAV1SBG5_9ROSI|nr:unnamed protein product [Dovyalis caffra]